MKFLSMLIGTLLLMASSAQANHYDGIYKLSTRWAASFCGAQEITIQVKRHRFDFRDSGNYRYKGKIDDKGLIAFEAFASSGEELKGDKVRVPRRVGLEHAIWGEIFWRACGIAVYRVYRESAN